MKLKKKMFFSWSIFRLKSIKGYKIGYHYPFKRDYLDNKIIFNIFEANARKGFFSNFPPIYT